MTSNEEFRIAYDAQYCRLYDEDTVIELTNAPEREQSVSKKRHIVVGAGTSGAILCDRLAKTDEVCLIEKGSRTNSDKSITDWADHAYNSDGATRHVSASQKSLYHRIMTYPQGHGIGGTMNINAGIWAGGHPAVFDMLWPTEWNSKVMRRCAVNCFK